METANFCAISSLFQGGADLPISRQYPAIARASDETKRIAALHDLEILDTEAEPAFDRIVALAVAIFGVPAALISLVDNERQWIKARKGLAITQTERDISFCAHTILQDDIFVILDTSQDHRFSNNPLVTGAPNIRFYAGAPLKTKSGHNIGTVCLIDFKPHKEFGAAECDLLAKLAAIATDELALREHRQNLTALVEAEAKARQKAEQATATKAQFIETMSHEIRTPLSGLIGMVDLLTTSGLRNDQIYYGNALKSAANHLLRVVNEVLDFSKLEAGALEYDAVSCDLSEIVENTISVVAGSNDRDLAIGVVINPDVPRTVICDSLRLQQILLNLVGNSIKFTHSGGVYISVSLTAPPANQTALIRFEVRDTGIGIPEEDIPRLFSRFSQLQPSIMRRYGGTGLGLSICLHLVQMMGGQISVESELGKGSMFSFVIPLEYRQGIVLPGEKLPTIPYNVLLVENNPVDQAVIRQHLENLGATVSYVNDIFMLGKIIREAEQAGDAFDALIIDEETSERLGIAEAIKASDNLFGHAKVIRTARHSSSGGSIQNILMKPVTQAAIFTALQARSQGPKNKMQEPVAPEIVSVVTPKESRLTVLLVEDNEINRIVATAMVKNIGHDIVSVTNGIEAISAVANGAYDLVLMDMMMPEIDGLTATRAIRRLRGSQANIYIIALTANASAEHQKQCFESGMNDFVTKPVARQRLEEAFGRYWQDRAARMPDQIS